MRNPLTAMTQLADGIAGCLKDDCARSVDDYRSIVEDNVEAAATILACAAHQKRVRCLSFRVRAALTHMGRSLTMQVNSPVATELR